MLTFGLYYPYCVSLHPWRQLLPETLTLKRKILCISLIFQLVFDFPSAGKVVESCVEVVTEVGAQGWDSPAFATPVQAIPLFFSHRVNKTSCVLKNSVLSKIIYFLREIALQPIELLRETFLLSFSPIIGLVSSVKSSVKPVLLHLRTCFAELRPSTNSWYIQLPFKIAILVQILLAFATQYSSIKWLPNPSHHSAGAFSVLLCILLIYCHRVLTSFRNRLGINPLRRRHHRFSSVRTSSTHSNCTWDLLSNQRRAIPLLAFFI